METINLLPKKSRLRLKQIELLQKLNLLAIIVLAVFLLSALIVFSYQLILSRQISENQAKLSQAKAQFSQYLDKLDELQNLRFRTKLVAETLEQRVLAGERVALLQSILAEEGDLEDLTVKGREIEAKGKAANLTALNEIENRLYQGEFQQADLVNLGGSREGISFSLKIKP